MTIDPLAYTASSEKSYFIEALLSKKSLDVLASINEIRNEANAIWQALTTPTEDELLYHQAFADEPFDETVFAALTQEKKRELFYIANIFGSFSFVENARAFIPRLEPLYFSPRDLFAHNMDITQIKDRLCQFLSDLKADGSLLKRSEFSLKSKENYIEKGDQIDRVIGRKFVAKIVQENGFKYVKVPKKIVVVENDKESLCLGVNRYLSLCSVRKKMYAENALTVYAEKITPVKRKLSLEEAKEFALALEFTGYNDFAGQNFIVAEDGIYFIDTEYHNFSPTKPSFTAMFSIQQESLATDNERQELKAFVEARKKAFDDKADEREQKIAFNRAAFKDPLSRLIDDLELTVAV